MNPAELACRCCLRIGDPTLPVDPLQMLRLARATFVYTREQALAERVPAEAIPPADPANPANVCHFVTQEGIERWIVIWEPVDDPAQQRFSFAHELGHIVMKHFSRERNLREEAEADAFARALLMPPPVIRTLQRACGTLYAEQLVPVFGVSLREALRLSGWRLPAVAPELAEAVEQLYAEAALSRLPTRIRTDWHPLRLPE